MPTATAQQHLCPQCRRPVATHAPEGLCPRCVAALSLGGDTAAGDGGEYSATPLLTPEELAPFFPQLEIIECLGRGGMGVVYKARQKSLHRFVALKLLAPERVTDPKFAQRFAQEGQALAALSHPNIVTVHELGQTDGLYFLMMEFVDGVSLRQAMKAGRFTPEQALAIVPPVCEALQYAHEHGIVHRDIKPENLLLDKQNRVKIADFGIAKMLHVGAAEAPAESEQAGTPQYMAPEQKEHRATDSRADIYSLGVVLYELLTGELPADKLQPPSSRPHGKKMDERFDGIVRRALHESPEMRYQTAADLRDHLETLLISPSRERRAPARAPEVDRFGPRIVRHPPLMRSRPVLGALALAGVIVLAAAWALLKSPQEAPAVPRIVDAVEFNSRDLNDLFAVNVQSGKSPYSLVPGSGLGGSRGIALDPLDPVNDATLVFKAKGYDLFTLSSLEASCFVRKRSLGPNPAKGALTIGLVGMRNGFLGGYNDPTTTDDAFVSVRIGAVDATPSPSTQWRLETQSKPGNSAAVTVASAGPAFTPTIGDWCHFRAIFTRLDETTIRVSGVVSSADANGQIGAAIRTLGPTDISIPDLASRHQVWVALRGIGPSGADVWDRLSIAANGVSAGVPAAPALTASDLDAYRTALSWADNSVNEESFIVSRAPAPGGPYSDLATLAANTTSYTDTTANRSKAHYYTVRAASAAGSSASNEAAMPAHRSPYRWTNVAIGGGGFVTGIFLHPTEPSLIYLRTDNGGFYRWDAAGSRWLPLMENLTLSEKGLFGGEGLALDRRNPDVVYAACGKYAGGSDVDGVIFKSADRGESWTRLPLAGIKMGGNESKRSAGERLAVSPHDSNVLLFGSRNDGLWRSTDAGVSWARAAGFPKTGIALIGVTSIAFDPQTKGVVYAAIYGDGVYRSGDDGMTWSPLPGGPAEVNRLAVSNAGTLFATHQSGVGRYTSGAWTLSAPGEPPEPLYGLSINQADPNDLLVAEGESKNAKIFRSRDGGTSWTFLNWIAKSSVPWFEAFLQMSNLSAIEFDPTAPGRVWATDGSGIWRTDDLNATPAVFADQEQGHERAVAFSLVALAKGAPLLSGSAYVDGFRHDHGLSSFPSRRLGLPGDRVQDTYCIAVCESDPSRLVRCVGNRTKGFHVVTSADGGATWALTAWNATFPTTMPLRAAISATDPENFVVITDNAPARVTTDGGASWQTVHGLPNGPRGGPWVWMQPLAADRQLGGAFYYHDGEGKVYRSTDQGLTFIRVNSSALPAQSWSMFKTLPGVASNLWVSLDGSGLYHSTNGGATFDKISAVSRAYLFAFGKPAPGRTAPALYLYGRVNGSGDEIFRSLDLGATWTELTDARVAVGDAPNVMEASAQTFGLVFIGTNGRGIYAGEPLAHDEPHK